MRREAERNPDRKAPSFFVTLPILRREAQEALAEEAARPESAQTPAEEAARRASAQQTPAVEETAAARARFVSALSASVQLSRRIVCKILFRRSSPLRNYHKNLP